MGFSQVSPLSDSAGGNQLLFLSGANTGVDLVTGFLIDPDTTYTLSAAFGDDLQTTGNNHWSLQVWADTDANGVFDGVAGDTFLGQQFGTSGTQADPAPGEWAVNSFSFDSANTPSLAGKHLIIFLNNFSTGTSYYEQRQRDESFGYARTFDGVAAVSVNGFQLPDWTVFFPGRRHCG